MKILVINGPNLNFLGIREPEIYGSETLLDIENKIQEKSEKLNLDMDFFQSNFEGEIIEKIQGCYKKVDYLIINPAALTHYSIGIRDAILSAGVKTIEVHLSNIYKREEFRKHSVISDISIGVITGFGSQGYLMALDFINSIKK